MHGGILFLQFSNMVCPLSHIFSPSYCAHSLNTGGNTGGYVDDEWLTENDAYQALSQRVKIDLRDSGLVTNEEKCQCEPCQIFDSICAGLYLHEKNKGLIAGYPGLRLLTFKSLTDLLNTFKKLLYLFDAMFHVM